jgi:hypothetical protein
VGLVGSGVALILAVGVMLAITRETSIVVLIGMSLLLGFMNGFSGFGNQAATDAGFHSLAWGLVGIGLVVLVLTALDRSVPHRRDVTGPRGPVRAALLTSTPRPMTSWSTRRRLRRGRRRPALAWRLWTDRHDDAPVDR